MPLDHRRKVALVGFCQTSREAAPYRDKTFEIWGLNRGYIFMPRADRWFEMHGQHIYNWQQRRPHKHVEYLQSFPGPVYMHEQVPEIKTSVVYPLAKVAANLGPWVWRIGDTNAENGMLINSEKVRDTGREPYLSSSIAYELALAIYEEFEEIHLYGIDLNTDSEYAWQKPGVEYLIGVANGRGIKVVLPDNCPLLKGNLYGRGYLSPKGEQMSYEQLESRMKAIQKQMKQLERQLDQHIGAQSELEFAMQQMIPGLDHEIMDDRHKKIEKNIAVLKQQLSQCVGGIKELQFWIHQTPDGQSPSEAMEQIDASLQSSSNGFADEGPRDDLEALMSPEHEGLPIPSRNGRKRRVKVENGVH